MGDQIEILSKLMKYCAYQDRSESEVRGKISSLQCEDIYVEELIQQLKKEKFIDDERFAEQYVKGKLRQKGWGRMKLKSYLYQKGISSTISKKVLSAISEAEYVAVFRQNIEKWLRINRLEDNDLTKLYRFLESKGFERDMIFRKTSLVVKELNVGRGET
ncbi:MAG: RecX family transcriptional regulator [Bacteroidales bacterium]|jgi:regulatory protein|nr:RecX family transcriptional regulator [Bacteroidales bacterium]